MNPRSGYFLRILPFVAATQVVAADDFLMQIPVDCTLGETCFIQNYVDAAPGDSVSDYTCGPLSYDAHKGTDFRLISLAQMQQGVTVLSAASGEVTATRDGMPDNGYSPRTEEAIAGKECGNGVLIEHGEGWQTQYCHMKQGSIAVAKGMQVEAGTPLGQVGLSGRSEFPHLHIALRRNGEAVDPFIPDGNADCTTPPATTHWEIPPPYIAGGIMSVGFATAVPGYDTIKAGTAAESGIARDAPALVLWGYLFGGRKGDVVRTVIRGPDGGEHDQSITLEKTQAQLFRASGKRLDDGLLPGLYRGTVSLQRDDVEIDREEITLIIR